MSAEKCGISGASGVPLSISVGLVQRVLTGGVRCRNQELEASPTVPALINIILFGSRYFLMAPFTCSTVSA